MFASLFGGKSRTITITNDPSKPKISVTKTQRVVQPRDETAVTRGLFNSKPKKSRRIVLTNDPSQPKVRMEKMHVVYLPREEAAAAAEAAAVQTTNDGVIANNASALVN